MTTDERQARLAVRHRLVPDARTDDDLVAATTLAAIAERGEAAATDLTEVVPELAIQIPAAEAQVELARRWLARFGPGTITDLKWWTGWSLGATRAAVAALDTEEVALDDGTVPLVLAGAAGALEERLGQIRIVPRFPTPLDKELSA